MSAYIVDRAHIAFLVEAGTSWGMPGNAHEGPLRWVFSIGRGSGTYRAASLGSPGRDECGVGQMLWDENRKSIEYRYPDCVGKPENRPGPIDESLVYDRHTAPPSGLLSISAGLTSVGLTCDPLQVLMSISCYEYQSCEHPGWEESESHAYTRALQARAITRLPGYESRAWGAPKAWEAHFEREVAR